MCIKRVVIKLFYVFNDPVKELRKVAVISVELLKVLVAVLVMPGESREVNVWLVINCIGFYIPRDYLRAF